MPNQTRQNCSTPAPMLSYIVPFFNNHDHLDACLASVGNHTSVPYEIIVVDDASETRHPLLEQLPEHTILINNECNRGPAACRNQGIKASRGEYIVFVDSDDFITSDLGVVIESWQKNKGDADTNWPDALVANFTDQNMIPILNQDLPRLTKLANETALMKLQNFTRILYRREFLLKADIRFSEDLRHAEDLLFLVQVLFKAAGVFLTNHQFYSYRRRSDSLTSARNEKNHFADRGRFFYKLADFVGTDKPESLLRLMMTFAWNVRMSQKVLAHIDSGVVVSFLEAHRDTIENMPALEQMQTLCVAYNVPFEKLQRGIYKQLNTGQPVTLDALSC